MGQPALEEETEFLMLEFLANEYDSWFESLPNKRKEKKLNFLILESSIIRSESLAMVTKPVELAYLHLDLLFQNKTTWNIKLMKQFISFLYFSVFSVAKLLTYMG